MARVITGPRAGRRDAIPGHLRSQVIGGTPASQRFSLAGSLQMGVGIPIPVVGGAYFEVFSLQELDHTLPALGIRLEVAARHPAREGSGERNKEGCSP